MMMMMMILISNFRRLNFLLLLSLALSFLMECNAEPSLQNLIPVPTLKPRFFKIDHWNPRKFFNFGAKISQFRGFLQFNERPRPRHHTFFDIRFQLGHKCRSWPSKTRTFDGSCNSWHRPQIGAAGTPFKLLSPFSLSLNISDATLPNPRFISNIISNDHDNSSTGNKRNMSQLVTFFGQFIDHTIAETENDKSSIAIQIPSNDTTFHDGVIPFFRTHKKQTVHGSVPVNLLSSFIDASAIYGPSETRARMLRTFENGLLRVAKHNLLPKDENGFYISGDKRANENPALTTMHTLFVREHNRVCEELKLAFTYWNDEKLYHIARKIVAAELQAIVYYEFLPTVLGHNLKPYRGYRRWVDPRVSNEFSTVAYRVGHSLINRYLTSIDGNGSISRVELRTVFFSPTSFKNIGVDNLLRGMLATPTAEVDVKVTDEVRNFLIAVAGSNLRLDLVALNIQRGRDHAVPHYNAMRKIYGLRPVNNFHEITSNVDLANKLQYVYKDVNRVDAWIGGLAEDHEKHSSLGALFQKAWIEEFTRLRDGDRLYFQRWNMFPRWWKRRVPTIGRIMKWKLNGGIMQRLIVDNTDIHPKLVKWNPFFV